MLLIIKLRVTVATINTKHLGVEQQTARQFVAAFYSSLARGTELSHETLDGKSLCCH